MIVCIGDSITAGQHINAGLAWPSQLERLIGDEVWVAGAPGDTTRLALERFPRDVQAVCGKHCDGAIDDAIIIQFGHNDANRWESDRGLPRVSIGAFEENLHEMVARCERFGAQPFLCSLTPSERSFRHAVDTARYDEVVRGVARETYVPLIDVRAAFEPVAGLLIDGLHLSEAGHLRYAETVAAALKDQKR